MQAIYTFTESKWDMHKIYRYQICLNFMLKPSFLKTFKIYFLILSILFPLKSLSTIWPSSHYTTPYISYLIVALDNFHPIHLKSSIKTHLGVIKTTMVAFLHVYHLIIK